MKYNRVKGIKYKGVKKTKYKKVKGNKAKYLRNKFILITNIYKLNSQIMATNSSK